jgi:hypothetical protein
MHSENEDDSQEQSTFEEETELLKENAQKNAAQEAPCHLDIIFDNVLENFNVLNILKKHHVYKRSNSVLNRNIHDLPTFTWTCVDNGCLTLAALPFFNQTSKMFFTENSPFIKSYINLGNNNLINDISQGLDIIPNLSIGKILPLFQQIKLEERRAGIYFRAASDYGPLTFQFSWPLLYVERNFILSPEEERKLKENEFISQFSTGTNKAETEAFIKPHVVSDKIGFGDMRFHALYTPYFENNDRFTIGGFITLPTAFAFRDGVIGSSFCKKNGRPPFNFEEILRVAFQCDKSRSTQIAIFNQLKNLALGVLDHLTGNFETGLGNNGHLTIGPLLEYEHRFNNYWGITTQANVQYVAPCDEIRAFIRPKNLKAFDQHDFKDPAQVEENIKFIQNRILDMFFLTPLKVKVQPGPIAQINSYLTYTYDCFKGSVGYDFWYQGQEKFKAIESPHPAINIQKALNPAGLQNKVFGSLLGTVPQGDGLLQLGLRWDYTFASRGIGKDFTLAADIQFLY